MRIEPLAGRDESAAELLADAFQEDPGYAWIFPDAMARAAFLRAFTPMIVEATASGGLSRCALDAAGRLVGVVTLVPPGPWPPGLWAQARMGARAWSLRHAGALLRAARRGTPYARRIEAFERGADRWALPLLGVARAARGTGVGSALLADACARADAAGEAIGLETQAPRNLPLYERFDFHIESEFQPSAEAAPMWLLTRAREDTVAPGEEPR